MMIFISSAERLTVSELACPTKNSSMAQMHTQADLARETAKLVAERICICTALL